MGVLDLFLPPILLLLYPSTPNANTHGTSEGIMTYTDIMVRGWWFLSTRDKIFSEDI